MIAAGGGAYYFAKKSINADRAQKADADRRKRQQQWQLEQAHGLHSHASPNPSVSPNAVVSDGTGAAAAAAAAPRGLAEKVRAQDEVAEPSREASQDPAATRHAPEGQGEKSKYEASDVFRSRKGDRFS